jgi:3-phosphoshikimate 1-carboxyvinyltransferase
MEVTISSSIIKGVVRAPPSKAYSHRALIASSLAGGAGVLENVSRSADALATMAACQSFGSDFYWAGQNRLEVIGRGFAPPPLPVNCGNSGATMNFLLPIASLLSEPVTFSAQGNLATRPLTHTEDALRSAGVRIASEGHPPITVHGPMESPEIALDGRMGSVFISGLLFAAPLRQIDTAIAIEPPLHASAHVRMTISVLREYGIKTTSSEDMLAHLVPAGQFYLQRNYKIEGDFFAAAVLLAAGAIAGKAKVTGLNTESQQGDRKIVDLLKQMGAFVSVDKSAGSITSSAGELTGIEIDAEEVPDLVPILAVLGCYASGKTTITNAGRLRHKGIDRLHAICENLRAMGAEVVEQEEGLVARKSSLTGAKVDSWGDHHVAMACALAALGARGKTTIKSAEAVSKSYPGFFSDLQKIGANVD